MILPAENEPIPRKQATTLWLECDMSGHARQSCGPFLSNWLDSRLRYSTTNPLHWIQQIEADDRCIDKGEDAGIADSG